MKYVNYYIGDMHLGHTGVINMDGRPFASIEEMDKALIDNWNKRVTNKDTVYIIGDLSMRGAKTATEYLKQLNGKKVLIKGNHDRLNKDIEKYYLEITPYKEIHEGGQRIILCHFPIMFFNRQHSGAIMLYAHVHNTIEYEFIETFKKMIATRNIPTRIYNVGCMMPYMNYAPRTLDEILKATEQSS